jgi:hypothetical protein
MKGQTNFASSLLFEYFIGFLCTKRMDDKTKIFSVAFPSAKRYRLIGGSQNFLPLFFLFFLSFFLFLRFVCLFNLRNKTQSVSTETEEEIKHLGPASFLSVFYYDRVSR